MNHSLAQATSRVMARGRGVTRGWDRFGGVIVISSGKRSLASCQKRDPRVVRVTFQPAELPL